MCGGGGGGERERGLIALHYTTQYNGSTSEWRTQTQCNWLYLPVCDDLHMHLVFSEKAINGRYIGPEVVCIEYFKFGD